MLHRVSRLFFCPRQAHLTARRRSGSPKSDARRAIHFTQNSRPTFKAVYLFLSSFLLLFAFSCFLTKIEKLTKALKTLTNQCFCGFF
jgi:hypothetical protein